MNTTPAPRALLFDMDGVLSDTQTLHADVESAVLSRHGINISPADISKRFSGVKGEEWFATISAEHQRPLDIPSAIEEKWQEFIRQLPARASAIPGGRELMAHGAEYGWRIGVVSASRHHVVEQVLEILGIRSLVQVVIGADDVSRGKPDPEGYLSAAHALRVPPPFCVVIEDGLAGIIAAQAGGMKTLGLGPHARQDPAHQPDIQTDSLSSVSIDDISKLIVG